MFAWMRPNDLIWNYWVNNYLLGNAPPAFDVLYWNSDTTRLPARLHADFLDLIGTNPFVHPGRLQVRGTALDMRRIDMDSYVVAGVTDHITPWQGCYNTARLYGARSTFVLSNSGHIQSLLNPPGNPKAFFWAGPRRTECGGVAGEGHEATGKLVAALAGVGQGALGRAGGRAGPGWRRLTRCWAKRPATTSWRNRCRSAFTRSAVRRCGSASAQATRRGRRC